MNIFLNFREKYQLKKLNDLLKDKGREEFLIQ